LLMPNSIEMDVALMAVMAVGAQVAPINPFLTPHELSKQLVDVEACAIISEATTAQKAAAVAKEFRIPTEIVLGQGGVALDVWTSDRALALDRAALPRADDYCLLIFTGGSTGVPKGVNHTHRGMLWSVVQHVTVWPGTYGGERFLNVAPMFHIWGLGYAAWVPIFMQSTLVMVPRYDPDKVVQALSAHKITIFAGGPAPIYMGLLQSPFFKGADLSQLRYCPSGGAPCPAELHREWRERVGQPLLEGWGMTEGAPFCLNLYDGERKLLSVGRPVPGTELQIVDLEKGDTVLPQGERGEVRVRGPQLMTGYRKRPEETAQALRDGWMHTGDIGYVDADGYLYLVDRKKDMVIVGGFNVYPREVDEVLFKHPKIREAATVGKADSRLGEVLVAFVVLHAGHSMSESEFFDYCKEEMVKYKRPVEVHFIEALPRTGTNKINRIALRTQV
jgi:long-chain acyl-CoA synthetase